MKQWSLFWYILYVCTTANSQISGRPLTAAYTGLGAYTIQHADVFSFSANPAALSPLKNCAVGITGENRYLLPGLGQYQCLAALVTSSGNFGWKADYQGSSFYNRSAISIAYGRKLGNKINAGAGFNYTRMALAGYGAAGVAGFEAGFLLSITEELHAGVLVSNPGGRKYGKNKQEKLPAVYISGWNYEVSPVFFLSVQLIKEQDQPVSIHPGLQYLIIPELRIRAGICSAIASPWIGFGFSLKSYRLDIIANYHPRLGVTPGLSLLFDFKKREK